MSLDRTTENDLVRRALEALSRGVSDPEELGLGPDVVDINDIDTDTDALEEVVVDPDDWDPTERNGHLADFFEHVSAWRRMVGFTGNNENPPKNLAAALGERESEEGLAEAGLRAACGSCALKLLGCPLADSLDLWIERHPYSDKGTPPDTEGRQQFKRRLAQNPKASCVPETNPELLEAVSHHPAAAGFHHVGNLASLNGNGAEDDLRGGENAGPPSPEILAKVRAWKELTKERLQSKGGPEAS